ncbi:MAG TPA: MaoC family dehydratase [Telluria sp.]|nr:MaoC family dehydratase [Telluria sp.]
MREFATPYELEALAGTEVAVSPWFDMTQQRVSTFADATDDHQWIHLDPQRCANESPYGAPIAHGFLTLSLLPAMLGASVRIGGIRLVVNYGLNKVRFPAAVFAGSRVRGRFVLAQFERIEGGAQLVLKVTVECEGAAKPACVAEFVIRCCE